MDGSPDPPPWDWCAVAEGGYPSPNGNGTVVNIGCAPAITTRNELPRRQSGAGPYFSSAKLVRDTDHKLQ